MKKLFFLAFLTCSAFSQDTIRVASYNLLNYPGTDASQRNRYFRSTMLTMDPDVLVVQEMQSQTGVTTFLNDVLNSYRPNTYVSVPFNNGPDTDNSFFYKPSKVVFVRANYIPTALRNIAEYFFRTIDGVDTVRIFSLHLKAGFSDSIARLNEATILRNYLNNLPPGSKFIVAGDFNIYRSTEPAFLKLTGSESNNNGRCKDPLNAIGNWNNNFNFRFIHTQSTRTRSFGGGATGGMDDRFDMILISSSLDQSIITSSYTAYGNDGNHFNDSINRPPNSSVPDSIANALHYASDHLPVFASFVFPTSAQVQTVSVTAGWNLISVPRNVPDYARTMVFPTSISAAWLYSGGGGYSIRDTLANSLGYWLKFPTSQLVTIAGNVRHQDTIAVYAGWNLIGTITDSVAVSTIIQSPPNNVLSPYFDYNGAYVANSALSPGRGYWVKVLENGTLVLQPPGE